MEPTLQVSTARFQHRDLALLVGILSGTLLVIFASQDPLSNFQPIDLILFFAVPGFAGAITGFVAESHRTENGAIVGLIIGLVYAILNGIRLGTSAVGEQVLFLILTVPIWGFFGRYGSVMANQILETGIERPTLPWPDSPSKQTTTTGTKICDNCKVSNPVDALFCKSCGSKLGLISTRS